MFCVKCGSQILENTNICPKCKTVTNAVQPKYNGVQYSQGTATQKEQKGKTKNKSIIVLFIVAAVLLVALIAIVLILGKIDEIEYGSDEDNIELNDAYEEDEEDEEIVAGHRVKTDVENEHEGLTTEEAELSINSILDELSDFRYYFFDVELPRMHTGNYYDLDLDTYEVTKAAGISKSVRTGDEEEWMAHSGTYLGKYVDEERLNTACMDLFGKNADINVLEDDSDKTMDLILRNDDPVYVFYEGFDERIDVLKDTDINIDVDKGIYQAIQYTYYGFWKYDSGNRSNYKIVIDFEGNAESKYGLIISSVHIEKTEDEKEWDAQDTSSETASITADTTEFYGIWCYGSKNESEAKNYADDMKDKGIDAYVLLSSEWSNLNKEPYYVVTAGIYQDEESAKQMLQGVKDAGYTDAYVKYSGLHM